MRKLLFTFVILLGMASLSYAGNGIISKKSSFNVKTTANRLEKILKNKGMTVFTKIDHSAGAVKAGKKLLPTVLIIFGNPKIGTPLMLSSRSIAIDLPQKALIWEDSKGQVWFSYNDPKYLAKRHKITDRDKIFMKIEKALANFAKKATSND